MREAKSCYGRQLGSLIGLLLITCLATEVEGEPQPESLSETKLVAGEAADGLVSWSLSGRDFDCLQDRQACSVAAGQAAGVQVTRKTVDMRPCLSTVSPAQAGKAPTSQVGEIPACYFEFFADMQDVDYPAPELLWQAFKARVSLVGFNNPQRKKIIEVIDRYSDTQIDATVLQSLRGELGILAQFESLNGRSFQSGKELIKELDRLYIALGERFEQYRSPVLAQARKVHRYGSAVQWQAAGKYAQRDLAGEVYGFMPFWLAGDTHVIDFCMQTRLGYYAVGFDDRGVITRDEGWRALDADFADKLRGNGGKLDMVVYRNDWTAWGQLGRAEKKLAFSRLAENIVKLIEIPRSNLFSRLKPFLTLGLSTAPVMGDGVTLYFEHYPQDGESVAAFSQFLDELGDKLHTDKRDFSLNIMFRSKEIGKGIFDYRKLIERVERSTGKKQKILLLALLPEPTTNEKKQLRQDIENALHGEQRRSLLRHIVTVISFDGHNKNQLVDDIIYAKDNFGGIGFWMQRGAANNNEADTAVSSALYENYRP